jgi:nucleotide-binding universal stress UspA family protein
MMDPKRIVVAVDGSENSWRAVDYVAQVVGGVPDVWVCILFVERLPSRDLFATEEAWQTACRIQKERLDTFLEQCRRHMDQAGIAAEIAIVPTCQSIREEMSTCSLGTSIARDIIAFQERGGFGTLVIGRRGVSRTEEFLFGSVTTKVTHLARQCAVWVVR